jgi:hypothetical protein
MLLVVVEDTLDRQDTWIIVAFVGLAGALLVPVKNLSEKMSIKPINRTPSKLVLTRPTKGEIRVTPASAQATAWPKPNSRVRLQLIPSSLSSSLAAWIPSQVDAILIRIRSFLMPIES